MAKVAGTGPGLFFIIPVTYPLLPSSNQSKPNHEKGYFQQMVLNIGLPYPKPFCFFHCSL